MTAKEIRFSLKAGRKVTFNRHITGSMSSFERLPVLAAKEVHGATWVRFMWFNHRNNSSKLVWAAVQPDLDDYVSLDIPPHGACSLCSASLTRIEARDNSHQCGVAPQEEKSCQ